MLLIWKTQRFFKNLVDETTTETAVGAASPEEEMTDRASPSLNSPVAFSS